MIYAGIGARTTPPDIIELMRTLATAYAKKGYTLQTGAAKGADQAYAEGALYGGGRVRLYLPWPSYEQEWVSSLVGDLEIISLKDSDKLAHMSVAELHPTFENLSQGVRKLHARNFLILKDAEFVSCWTPRGLEEGGTGQGLRIAERQRQQIWNLGNQAICKGVVDRLKEIGEL